MAAPILSSFSVEREGENCLCHFETDDGETLELSLTRKQAERLRERIEEVIDEAGD